MEILAVGINHQSAPLELREALRFDAESMAAFLRLWMEAPPREGLVGLSTCNRTEFYAATRQPERARAKLFRLLERARGAGLSGRDEAFYTYLDADAAAHLCRVASGIDSLVIGEDQILAQVKQAYQQALDLGASSPMLNLLFNRALRVAKRARAETKISQGNISVASVAVSFIRKMFAHLERHRALLIGAGETAELVAQSLVEAGARSLAVANRTPERAAALAERFGGRPVDFANLEPALEEADIVICATSAPEPILTAPMLKRVMNRREDRLLAAIDISVPRNIEPAADGIAQLFVYDMDALEEVCEENRTKRRAEAREVEEIIAEEVRNFLEWTASLDAKQVVAALRRRMEEIRRAEIERYGGGFPEPERAKLEKFTQSLLNKVMHDLTMNLKSLNLESEDGLMEFDALCRALNLDPAAERAGEPQKAQEPQKEGA
ncbi:MAG: glutamyl-tRNA reductase [Candidatus Sumerlaeota bacterium]|nr:glutamyl-tRNA reductase [Candidatus Sumerlaeota bacterium]